MLIPELGGAQTDEVPEFSPVSVSLLLMLSPDCVAPTSHNTSFSFFDFWG